MNIAKLLFLRASIVLLLVNVSCVHHKSNDINRAFYYWKTTFKLSAYDLRVLDSLHINKLYVRHFDVDNNNDNKAEPIGIVQFLSPLPPKIEIIPVIFIRNRVFEKITPEEVFALVEKLNTKIYAVTSSVTKTIKEIQIDCDWTISTKKQYFFFLQKLKSNVAPVKISTTIRLHQVKYSTLTGIPPVDRGILMFYNMGDLNNPTIINSIYDAENANRYVSSVNKYNIPLDVALPIFSWIVQQREGKAISLITNLTEQDFRENTGFSSAGNLMYIANSSFFLHGNYIMKDDLFRVEEINPHICLEAAEKISGNLLKTNRSVILFDLDSTNISHYEQKDFEEIFRCFL